VDLRFANGKALKSSAIKSFCTGLYGLEGCCASSRFDNASFSLLPATLEKFSLDGGGNFRVPFAFPPTLRELSLGGVRFSSNKLGLPKNCNIKKLKLELGFSGAEDSPEHKFESFDVTDLPDCLEHFEIDQFPMMGKFSASSQLKTLMMGTRCRGNINLDMMPSFLEELQISMERHWDDSKVKTTISGTLSRSRFPVLRTIKSQQVILDLFQTKASASGMNGLQLILLVEQP
jgi:hypothetical protein